MRSTKSTEPEADQVRNGALDKPPHPATVAQRRPAPRRAPAKPPHPATIQRRPASPPAQKAPRARTKPPHPATVAQRRPAPPSPPQKPPHPATVAQRRPAPPSMPQKPPHPATLPRTSRAGAGPARAAQRSTRGEICMYCLEPRGATNSPTCPKNAFDGQHEWIEDYRYSESEPTSSSYETVSEQVIENPSSYDKAKSWEGLRLLIQPYTVLNTESQSSQPPYACWTNFNKTTKIHGVCDLLCDTETRRLENVWTKHRSAVIGDIRENKRVFLTHTGVVRAEVVLKSGMAWTFYGAAANVCMNGSHRVVHLFNGKNEKDVQGSCHTEQLCMYWLHDKLTSMHKNDPIKSISFRWYTEKPMCEMWCVPALKLFINYWSKQGAKVSSEAFEVSH